MCLRYQRFDLVKSPTDVYGRLPDDIVDDLGKRSEEVGGVDLRVEEDLGSEEALISDVDRVFLECK
jgi:hypothetical protein